ncbi:MAG: 2-oxoglutarate dehydrogenase E1 component, partial [Leptospiraceae bacterium]|nr:2-oxoglutarate dehydrogenase E1 component [Leptospiraceae bacterium]
MNNEQLMSLSGDNALVLEELYENYKNDPSSVSTDWQLFFKDLENGNGINGSASSNGNAGIMKDTISSSSLAELGIINILNAYRRQGHLAADIDPLKIHKPNRKFIDQKLASLKQEDLETEIDTKNPVLGKTKLKNVIDWYEKTYCRTIGCEQYYLVDEEERSWLQERMESTANSY